MGQSYDNFRVARRFAGLDGVRAFAVLAVLEYHSFWQGPRWWHKGFLGVDLFFVLSGFLIGTLLLRERDATGRIDIKAFWIRRARRLFPAFYGLLAILTAYYLILPDIRGARSFFAALPYNVFFLANWTAITGPNVAQLWSLAAEQQFYLLWPLIVLFVPRWTGWLIAFYVISALFFTTFEPTGIASGILGMYLGIAVGLGLAHILHDPRGYAAVATFARLPVVVALFAGGLAACFAVPDIRGLPRFAFLVGTAAIIAHIVLRPRSIMVLILELRVLRRLGTVSYGIYLYHYIAMRAGYILTHPFGIWGGPVLFVVTAIISYALAELSFRLVEKRFLQTKRRNPKDDALTPAESRPH